jgi:hypothetical protein
MHLSGADQGRPAAGCAISIALPAEARRAAWLSIALREWRQLKGPLLEQYSMPVSNDSCTTRVVVGQDFGLRSMSWRIWSHRNEIYVPPRSLASEIKTSLHSSGRFRHPFTEQARSGFAPDGDRAWFKWSEPEEFVAGARHLLEIVIPTDDLTTPPQEPKESEKRGTTLFDPAPAHQATISRWLRPRLAATSTRSRARKAGFPPASWLIGRCLIGDRFGSWGHTNRSTTA